MVGVVVATLVTGAAVGATMHYLPVGNWWQKMAIGTVISYSLMSPQAAWAAINAIRIVPMTVGAGGTANLPIGLGGTAGVGVGAVAAGVGIGVGVGVGGAYVAEELGYVREGTTASMIYGYTHPREAYRTIGEQAGKMNPMLRWVPNISWAMNPDENIGYRDWF